MLRGLGFTGCMRIRTCGTGFRVSELKYSVTVAVMVIASSGNTGITGDTNAPNHRTPSRALNLKP